MTYQNDPDWWKRVRGLLDTDGDRDRDLDRMGSAADGLLRPFGEKTETPHYQRFHINEDRMENLLDTLNALVGGDVEVNRSITNPSIFGFGQRKFPGGLAWSPGRDERYPHPRFMELPITAWPEELARGSYPQFLRYDTPSKSPTSPFSAENLPSDQPYAPFRGGEKIFLAGAGDRAPRAAGEGFERSPSGEPMVEEWSPAERFVAMHEYGHIADMRNILPESLEEMQEESGAPMYPWHYMGGDEEGGRKPSLLARTMRALESKIPPYSLYKHEKFATQFGKAVEILQDSLDPERRSEAVNRINSREMRLLVEELLKHPAYENHPLRDVIIGLANPPVMQQDVTGIRGIE